MDDFGINEMLEMQKVLQDKYNDIWETISPEVGQNKLLWMIGEIGEVEFLENVLTHVPRFSDQTEQLRDVIDLFIAVIHKGYLKKYFTTRCPKERFSFAFKCNQFCFLETTTRCLDPGFEGGEAYFG